MISSHQHYIKSFIHGVERISNYGNGQIFNSGYQNTYIKNNIFTLTVYFIKFKNYKSKISKFVIFET